MILSFRKTFKYKHTTLILASLLATTALTTLPNAALAQDSTGSVIGQIGTDGGNKNSVTIQRLDEQNFTLKSAVSESDLVQDATTGDNTLDLTIKNSGGTVTTENKIFVTQMGGVISTITIDGGDNTVRLNSIGGYLDPVTDEIVIEGDGNSFTMDNIAPEGGDGYLDGYYELVGNNQIVAVTTDAFSQIWLKILGSGDKVTITQDNSGEVATEAANNDINANIDSNDDAYAEESSLNNQVTIVQMGAKNILDFDLIGNLNVVSIKQTNSVASDDMNDLTVELNDSNASLDVEVHGSGINSIISTGSNNKITLDSDDKENSVSLVSAEADVEITGNDNEVIANNFSELDIQVGYDGDDADVNTEQC